MEVTTQTWQTISVEAAVEMATTSTDIDEQTLYVCPFIPGTAEFSDNAYIQESVVPAIDADLFHANLGNGAMSIWPQIQFRWTGEYFTVVLRQYTAHGLDVIETEIHQSPLEDVADYLVGIVEDGVDAYTNFRRLVVIE